MSKWTFVYSRADGKQGHVRVTASSKPEAIKKGMEHAKRHANVETVTRWDCKLAQA